MRLMVLMMLTSGLVIAQPAPAGADAPRSLKQVDWGNRNYGRRMRLHNGRYIMRRYFRRGTMMARRCRHTSVHTRLRNVHYADLRGNGKPEALVELTHHADFCSGRPVNHRVLIAFAMTKRGVTELARFTPDRVTKVRVIKRDVLVQRREGRNNVWHRCDEVWRLGNKGFKRLRQRCTPEP